MIPGVISTGIESWGTEDWSRQYFRKRLWGSWSMMRALVLDKPGWKKHIMLDKKTGLDPPGVKLRASQGFDAADFFITGYWIWNKILENLATIGYDPTNAFTAAYDWRMSYMNYEIRDQYFTRLKNHIEIAKHLSGEKSVLLSHSMGSQVLFYFLRWVEAEGYGNGGPSWVNDHIESWINISGCMLGALKDVPAVLSGEMRDTVQLNALAVYGLEKFLSRAERAEIFRAMPGISSMLPIGGTAVWGDENGAPDDTTNQTTTFGKFLNFKKVNNTQTPGNMSVDGAIDYLIKNTEQWYVDQIQSSYSRGVAHSKKVVEDNLMIPAKWMNPLETRLPIAPDMKIFCFYGIGKPTERAYYYREEMDAKNDTAIMIGMTFSFLSNITPPQVTPPPQKENKNNYLTQHTHRLHHLHPRRPNRPRRSPRRRRRHRQPPQHRLHVQQRLENQTLQPRQHPHRRLRNASRTRPLQPSRWAQYCRSRRHSRSFLSQ